VVKTSFEKSDGDSMRERETRTTTAAEQIGEGRGRERCVCCGWYAGWKEMCGVLRDVVLYGVVWGGVGCGVPGTV
jgi:hypothetical protein